MADCDGDESNTSDEHIDPHCEPCFDSKKCSIHVHGYCHECYQFMCIDCLLHHGKFPALKTHAILRGSEMPKTIADKPPKYERCDDHPGRLRERFCFDHKELICSTCSSIEHTACSVKLVEEACKTSLSSYLGELCIEKNLNDVATRILIAVESNINDLEEQRTILLHELQNVETKVNTILQNMKLKVAAECQAQREQLNEDKMKMDEMMDRAKKSIDEIDKLKDESINVKSFLKMQEQIRYLKQIEEDINTLYQSRRYVWLTIEPSNLLKDIMSDSATFGTIRAEESEPDAVHRKGETHPKSTSSGAKTMQDSTRVTTIRQTAMTITPLAEIGMPDQAMDRIIETNISTECSIIVSHLGYRTVKDAIALQSLLSQSVIQMPTSP